MCSQKVRGSITTEAGRRDFGGQPKVSVLTPSYNNIKKQRGKRLEGNKPMRENMSLEKKTPNSYFCFFCLLILKSLPWSCHQEEFFSWILLFTLPLPSLGPVFWVSLPEYSNPIRLLLSFIWQSSSALPQF